jgi:hypothetical protein
MRVRMTRAFAVISDDADPFVVQLTPAAMECTREGDAIVLDHPHGAVRMPAAMFLRFCEQGCLTQVPTEGAR